MAVILRAVRDLDAMQLAVMVIAALVFIHPVVITLIDLASSELIIEILDGLCELEIERIIHTDRPDRES
ncbi:hypothetical protein ACWD25_20620 [Streptomyces sp. NPDC002920]